MPPLNHRTDLVRDGYVYIVEVAECNDDRYSDGTHTRDTHMCSNLPAALQAAEYEHDDPPLLHRTGTGMVILDEPHDEGERHLRTSIRKKVVYGE
jgi:hypothetical protein